MSATYKKPGEAVAPEEFPNTPVFLQAYLRYLIIIKGRPVPTIIDNVLNLREYCQYVHFITRYGHQPHTPDAHRGLDVSVMPLSEICGQTEADVERYLCFLDTAVKLSRTTIQKKALLIRKFYGYMESNAGDLGIFPYTSPAANIRVPKISGDTPELLSLEQIQKLCNSTTGETAVRDRAILMLFVTCGLSPAQVAALDVRDVATDTISIGTGVKRTLCLTPAAKDALDAHLSGLDQQSLWLPLFTPADSTRRLTVRAINKRVSAIAKTAGMEGMGITPRMLRESGTALMLGDGLTDAEIHRLSEYLGYKDTGWVKRYGVTPAKNLIMRSPVARIGGDAE